MKLKELLEPEEELEDEDSGKEKKPKSEPVKVRNPHQQAAQFRTGAGPMRNKKKYNRKPKHRSKEY